MKWIYECIKCGHKFESNEAPYDKVIIDPPYCPKCGGYTIAYRKSR
ncbi:MAG TPA: zinc ribbon domain-containing protein [Thermoprotei archaeon]|nr:zinc ribbon domain-containing protein [Thermoprotei archaeon]